MHRNYGFIVVAVRVSVIFGRLAVSRPAGMPDSARAVKAVPSVSTLV